MRRTALALLLVLGPMAVLASGEPPRAIATFESIGLYWKPPRDPGAAGCRVQYRRSDETGWRAGLELWYDRRDGECRGSLVHLRPGSAYDIRLAAEDASVEISARTWTEAFPIARVVHVKSGTRTLEVSQAGSASGYVLYTPAPGERATLDAGNAHDFNITVHVPYVIVRGLVLKGAKQDAIRIYDGAHDVVIEDNDISGWGRLRSVDGAGQALGADMDSAVRARCARPGMERLVVQRNRIHDPRYGANSWSSGHPAGPQAITLSFCGGNHVIRHNDIASSEGHYYNDAIGGEDNFSATGFPNADSDIYGNLISHAWDDAIEAEGGNRNVRIWGNYIDRAAIAIATTPTHLGPVYLFRNVFNRSRTLSGRAPDGDERNGFAKSGSTARFGGGRRYLFHNTLLQASEPGSSYPLGAGVAISGTGANQPITNTVSRNNVFQVWKAHWSAISQAGAGNDFDYDLFNGRADEPHGIHGVPRYQPGHGATSGAGGRYQLAPESPGHDAGVLIPNFNDAYTGAAPDIGAHEAGTPPMRFGPRATAPD